MLCTSTVVENPGPPSVMMLTWSKILKELMVARVMQKKMLDESMGIVIRKNVWKAFAPSTAADS